MRRVIVDILQFVLFQADCAVFQRFEGGLRPGAAAVCGCVCGADGGHSGPGECGAAASAAQLTGLALLALLCCCLEELLAAS